VETADVVVVGGGIMGCALAYQLARRGSDVVLYDRDALGSQSTAKNAGGVRQQFSTEDNVRVQMLAVRMLKEFEEELGAHADFRQVGYLIVLSQADDVEEFHRLLEMWHRVGLADARWVDPQEAARMVPVLNVEDVLGCTFCPSDGIASPADVTGGYIAAARRHGARLHEGVAVTGIDVTGGRVSGVRTTGGDVATRVVFNCAGAWAGEIGGLAGAEIPVRPYRRHIFVSDTFPAVTRTSPMTVDFTSTFYFHPEGDGVLFGMSDPAEPSTFNQDVSWDFLERVVAAAAHRAPRIAEEASVRTAWAGLYETTPDATAILGPVGALDGLWCACGFSGHGFMQAPAAALLLAQRLLDGKSEIDIDAFSPDRFAAGRLLTERNVI
jgi:sarcosine oxidase, subunit beta